MREPSKANIAKPPWEADTDYVLSVKESLGHIFEDISVLFAVSGSNFKYASCEFQKAISKGHDRINIRDCWSTSNLVYLSPIRGLENWAGLKSVAVVICTRFNGEKETKYVRYYIPSLLSHAARILRAVRKYWSIENELHQVSDVAMNEDRSRDRKDQAGENLAVLRYIALNLLDNRNKPPKVVSMPNNCKPDGRKDYFLKVLPFGN